MKALTTRLLLTVLSPLVFSLSCAKTANANTKTTMLGNGGYVSLTCKINPDKSKVVTVEGELGELIGSHLSLYADKHKNKGIKQRLRVRENGNLYFTKTLRRRKVNTVTLEGTVIYPNGLGYGVLVKDVPCS